MDNTCHIPMSNLIQEFIENQTNLYNIFYLFRISLLFQGFKIETYFYFRIGIWMLETHSQKNIGR